MTNTQVEAARCRDRGTGLPRRLAVGLATLILALATGLPLASAAILLPDDDEDGISSLNH